MSKSDKVKEKIVSSTIEILRQTGYARIKDISDNAEVNIAAINYHFRDKMSLINLIIAKIFDEGIESAKETEIVLNQIEDKKLMAEKIASFMCHFVEHNVGVLKFIIGERECEKEGIISTFYNKFEELFTVIKKYLLMLNMQESGLKIKFAIMFSGYFMPLIFNLTAIASENSFSEEDRNRLIEYMVVLLGI